MYGWGRYTLFDFSFVLHTYFNVLVNRMIKYTGYGNAAGLFANRGLLGGKQSEEAGNYSSDSEDSETEEYREHKHGINPVMGCYEAPRPDPTANMTEEQVNSIFLNQKDLNLQKSVFGKF